MKKIIFGLIATVMFGNLFAFSNEVNDKMTDGTVEVTFEIGRKSKDCRGFGICRVEKVKIIIKNISFRQQSEQKIVKAKLTTINGKILLSIDKENSKIIEENFKGLQLIIEENFEIEDKEILNELKIGKITIKEGIHKLNLNEKNSNYELYL